MQQFTPQEILFISDFLLFTFYYYVHMIALHLDIAVRLWDCVLPHIGYSIAFVTVLCLLELGMVTSAHYIFFANVPRAVAMASLLTTLSLQP